MLRIHKDGKRKLLSIGLSIHPQFWDFSKNEPKPKCPNKDVINKIILDKKTEYRKEILELNAEQKDYTASSLVENKKTKYEPKTVIQAIEGYHRRFVNNNSRIYLSKRLEELYENFNDIKLITNNKVDIRKATASRNYYSHFYSKDGETNICEGFELFELTMNLKLLLICCTLDLIGFEKQEMDKLLSQNNKLIQRYSQ